MSYSSDGASIKANEKAYANFRDKVKWGTATDEADKRAVSDLRAATTDQFGNRIGGFDQSGHSLGSNADEINYRVNKKGSFTMEDLNDMDTFGGRANDDGILVRGENDKGIGVSGGKNGGTWREIDDMINNNTGDNTYKFDQDVIDHVAGRRKEYDAKKAREDAPRKAREAYIKADVARRKAKARAEGKPFGSVEIKAANDKRDRERATEEGPEALAEYEANIAAENRERQAEARGEQAGERGGQEEVGTPQSQPQRSTAKSKTEAYMSNKFKNSQSNSFKDSQSNKFKGYQSNKFKGYKLNSYSSGGKSKRLGY